MKKLNDYKILFREHTPMVPSQEGTINIPSTGGDHRDGFFSLILLVLIIISSAVLNGQTQNVDTQVAALIQKIEQGHVDEAKKALPDLTSKYPNNPGVLYLQGRLASNGVEALKYYQSIVDNFPKSRWTDGALYATYQYYYALGLYKTADLKLQQLKRDFPDSPYLSGKTISELPSTENKEVHLQATKDVTVADTAASETTKTQAQTPPTPPPPAEPYTLQVGAYSTVKNAEKQKDYLEKAGVSAVITNKVRGGRSLYLVWAGSFTTTDQAKAFGKKLKQEHKIDSMVVEKY